MDPTSDATSFQPTVLGVDANDEVINEHACRYLSVLWLDTTVTQLRGGA